MKEGFIKDTYELVIKEIQTVLSISYITIVGIGMLFSYQKYAEFGINIFDYSDILDFLIAPFSDIYILLYAFAPVPFVVIILKLDAFSRKKWPKFYSRSNFGRDKKPWFKMFRMVVFGFAFLLYIYISSELYGQFAREKVVTGNDISIVYADKQVKTGKLIGKTKDVIFLLDGEEVSALPINSLVKEIKIQ